MVQNIDNNSSSKQLESRPLEVVRVSDNSMMLKLSDNHQFKVPLAVLPDETEIPKKVLLKIKTPKDSVFAEDLIKERHRRLQDMIN